MQRSLTTRLESGELIWLVWLVATVVASSAGFVAGSLIDYFSENPLKPSLQNVIIAGALDGALVGFAQWLVLRKSTTFTTPIRLWHWVLLTAIAGSIVWVICLSKSYFVAGCSGCDYGAGIPGIWDSSIREWDLFSGGFAPDSLLLGLYGGLAGLCMGVLQWVVLRRRVAKSGLWLLSGALGGAIGLVLLPPLGDESGLLLLWVVEGGGVFSCAAFLGGLVLAWWLAQSRMEL